MSRIPVRIIFGCSLGFLLLIVSSAFAEWPSTRNLKVKTGVEFEPNQGQAPQQVRALAHASGTTAYFTDDGVVFVLLPSRQSESSPQKATTFAISFDTTVPEVETRLIGVSNYFRGSDSGKWISAVPHYARLRYRNVKPGIDLVFYGTNGQLEYDVVLHPGADINSLKLKFTGAQSITTAADDILMRTKYGVVTQHRPLVLQDGKRLRARQVAIGNEVRFEIDKYDRKRDLRIDPVLSYSTFLGGHVQPNCGQFDCGEDVAVAVAVDSAGHAFVTGHTKTQDFPTTPGAYDRTCGTDGTCNLTIGGDDTSIGEDVFVTKFNAAGSGILYSTYIGGGAFEEGEGIAVDTNGNAYVAGFTDSADFPGKRIGDLAGFVLKLNPTGTSLVYSLKFGGTPRGIAIDTSGHAFVAGDTPFHNLPTTTGAFQTTYPCTTISECGFVAKVNAAGTGFAYATYLGGDNVLENNPIYDIALDSTGHAYVIGSTTAPFFPTTPGAWHPNWDFGLNRQYFLAKLNFAGSGLLYSTFLAGTGDTNHAAVALDKNNNAYVTGTNPIQLETTLGTLQPNCCSRGFLLKLNASGSAPVYSTFLPAGGIDVAVNSSGQTYLTGYSNTSTFSPTMNAFRRIPGGPIVAKVNSTGSKYLYASYLGDNGCDFSGSCGTAAGAVALDPSGNASAVGFTLSKTFTTTPGSFQPTSHDGGDAYVVKIIEPNCTLNITNKTVTLCAPASNATVHSPVQITAMTADSTPVRLVQVYVDGVKKYQAPLSAFQLKLSMAAGLHRLTVQAVDTANNVFKRTVFITVQ